MIKEFYQPYFEAVKQILDGTPVRDLDDIRQQCNELYLRFAPSEVSEPRGYNSEALIVSFVADAENNILKGMNPLEAYSCFKELEPSNFRQRGRKVLEHVVQQQLSKADFPIEF